MNQLQKQILFLLEESNKKRNKSISVSLIVNQLKKNEEAVKTELAILANNNLIEIERSPSGRIKKAKIKPEGQQHFIESTAIVTKESIQEQINELKQKLSALETTFQQVQDNPSEENKKNFIDQFDKFQSVVNGVAPWVKAGWNLLHK